WERGVHSRSAWSIELILHPRADIPGTLRAGLVETAVAVADDHRADVFTIQQVIDAQHLTEGQRAETLLETRLPVEQRVARGRLGRVAVLDVELAAVQAFNGGAEALPRLPGEFAKQGAGGDPRQV